MLHTCQVRLPWLDLFSLLFLSAEPGVRFIEA